MSRLFVVALALVSLPLFALEYRGQVSVEHRQFFEPGMLGQQQAQSSLVLQPELYHRWQRWDFSFIPFARIDSLDDERTHWDIREALFSYYHGDIELKWGIGKVFWGVTESQHLVDVINQIDAVESVDGEQKLGQPMVNASWFSPHGTFSLFVLPGFRERTFAGVDGRLGIPNINPDDSQFEARNGDRHIDMALRYSVMMGTWDLGLSVFHGTNREPVLLASGDQWTPYYSQMTQYGLDMQGIYGDWLFKWESIYRQTEPQDFSAITAGFEYTQVGIFATSYDLGWLGEYLYDSREQPPTSNDNDVFLGWRFVMNDIAGTEVLVGVVQDLERRDSSAWRLEASRRINNALKWRANAWLFASDSPEDPLYLYRDEDFVELALDYYF
uniref:hypothetical protein n=1 Tax=Thaumasiovibrio occultus TaxID=1891184 RepID=UPI000B34AD27|nr:hypothetical protein [Thaumasiovibrio occultus]